MRLSATVTVEFPMSAKTVEAVEAAKAAHDAAMALLDETKRRPFSANDVHQVGAVARELDARAEEGRAAMKSAMKGWQLGSDDLHMFVGGARGWSVIYQQRWKGGKSP